MLWSASESLGAARCGTLLRGMAMVVYVMALSGCASSIAVNVTTYQKWPSDAVGETYRIAAQASQSADNLEFQTVADMVRANIGATGLVEITEGQDARFTVRLQYENPLTQIWIQRYADYYPYYPWFSPYSHYGYRRGGWYAPPPLVTVPVQVYRNTLTLWITDARQHNAEVYRTTAIQLGESDQWIAAMPYLTHAIFDGFPGNNRQVRQMHYQSLLEP